MYNHYTLLYEYSCILNHAKFIFQGDKKYYNKGILFNAGFTEITKDEQDYDCIILHDVDNYPEDTRNLYMCDDRAIHLVSKQRHVGKKEYRE